MSIRAKEAPKVIIKSDINGKVRSIMYHLPYLSITKSVMIVKIRLIEVSGIE